MVRHKSIHSSKSAIYFDLDKDIINEIVTLCFTTIKQILHQPYLMEVIQ